MDPLQRNLDIGSFVAFCAAHYNMNIMITYIAAVDIVIADASSQFWMRVSSS